MPLTYYLLQLPSFILLLLVVALFAAVAIGFTYTFRRYFIIKSRKMPTEIRGDLFGLLGGIYGLLLGFVVVLVWGTYNSAQTDTAKEESVALGFYREIRYYPDSVQTAPLMQAYLAYVHSVIEQEYPQMAQMKPLTLANRAAFNEVYRQMELLNRKDPGTAKMMEDLDQLSMNRSLRQMDAYSDIPLAIWVPLLLGYIILIICALFLNIDPMRMHLLTNGLLGGFIGLIVYIILLVDHPFSGPLKIETQQYNLILQMAEEQ